MGSPICIRIVERKKKKKKSKDHKIFYRNFSTTVIDNCLQSTWSELWQKKKLQS